MTRTPALAPHRACSSPAACPASSRRWPRVSTPVLNAEDRKLTRDELIAGMRDCDVSSRASPTASMREMIAAAGQEARADRQLRRRGRAPRPRGLRGRRESRSRTRPALSPRTPPTSPWRWCLGAARRLRRRRADDRRPQRGTGGRPRRCSAMALRGKAARDRRHGRDRPGAGASARARSTCDRLSQPSSARSRARARRAVRGRPRRADRRGRFPVAQLPRDA